MNASTTIRATHVYGIKSNRRQFLQQLLQVFFVGLMLGSMRTVIPALAEHDFGVPRNSFLVLTSFIVAFGIVKAILNFVAGSWSECAGRKKVLLAGWLIALPIPFLILWAQSWGWIVAATVLLGINQGLTWSMTQTAKLDLATAQQRGLAIGLNEFAGYFGVAVAGVITSYAATALGARTGLFIFSLLVAVAALLAAFGGIRETLPWAKAEAGRRPASGALRAGQVFALMSWRDKRMVALCQAGLVEKFVDALVWVFYPVLLFRRGMALADIGWIVGVYGAVWGITQLYTGRLSDRVGRRALIVGGMWLCGLGVAIAVAFPDGGRTSALVSAAVAGIGMAMLYPTLSAAVSDLAAPVWRGTAIGIYRFWRDLGYAIGAAALALAASVGANIEAGFWLVAVSMFISGAIVLLGFKEARA